ncbi:MAG: trimethylamine methyltransferase family protein, partial [Candidatus Aminicenantes bacterium]|nr:trimethylamine methyltransferase family protein [Candidatus Aminicenantes bacterium]
MKKRVKSITHPRLSLNILSAEDIHQIHTATLDVIESVGVKFPSPKVLDLWHERGALVNKETSVVKIPGEMIEEGLKHAPPVFALAARDAALDLPL